MAAKKSKSTSGWLETMCSKYTLEETLNWALGAWSKSIKPEFARFRKAIADQTNDIPPSFFETKSADHGNRNPLFLFLRPKKLLYIALALDKGKKSLPLDEALSDYRSEWCQTLRELQSRLPSNEAATNCKHNIEHLCEQLYCLGNSDYLREDWYDAYRECYFRACESFGDIPWQIAKDKHAAKTLRDQIKIAIGKAPKEKQQRKKRVSGEEMGNRNVVVQKIIAMQEEAQKKGLRKLSVDAAILQLKRHQAWRMRVSNLNLKDNTIKALVRDAWSKIRAGRASS